MGNPEKNIPKRSSLRLNIVRIVALLLVAAISIFIFSIRAEAEKLAAFGYPGIFIISILANATIFLPAPGVAVVFAMGSIFNPLFVGVIAGLGAAIGELTGFLAGFGGQGVIENIKLYNRISSWMERFGGFTILVLAAIPNPFFDLAGMAAGALKMPVQKFFFWCALGEILKMLIFAYTGAYSVNWIFTLLK